MGLEGQPIPLTAFRGKKAVAFAAIARPESFYHLLRKAGIGVTRSFTFPDHHQYQEADMAMLMQAVKESHASFLITTEKDMVRLSPDYQTFTLAAVVEIDFHSEQQAFCSFLRERLPSR